MNTIVENTQCAYVVGCKSYPLDWRTRCIVLFDPSAEKAFAWKTRDEANAFCRHNLEWPEIKIAAFDDRPCKNFRVEERAPNEFVIRCDFPA